MGEEAGLDLASLTAGAMNSGLMRQVTEHANETVWLAIFAILTFMFVSKINPFRLVLRSFRLVTRLTTRPLRALRILRRLPRRPVTGNGTFTLIGPLSRLFGTETLVDQLLSDMKDKPDIELNRVLLFSWIRPLTVPVVEDEEDKDDVEKSKLLFHYDIPLSEILTGESHQYFYEDVEGSFIIRLFRGNDRSNEGIEKGPDDNFYLVANALRKKINDNVRIFATWLTLTLTAFFLLNIFHKSISKFVLSYAHKSSTTVKTGAITDMWPLLFQGDTYLVFTSIAAAVLILVFNFEYRVVQRNNIRELDSYCRSYFAYMAHLFNSNKASVLNAIGTDTASEVARTGITKIHWLAWRAFFIETFLRGVFYQIKRNSFHYTVFIPITFIFATSFVHNALSDYGSFLQYINDSEQSLIGFLIVFLILLAFYFRVLLNSPAILKRSIDESAWMEFHRLRVEEATNSIVGRFLQEISNWRDRFSGRGGGNPLTGG